MFWNKYLVFIFIGKHGACVKFQTQRRHMSIQFLDRSCYITTVSKTIKSIIIRYISRMAKRKTKVLAFRTQSVQLARRDVVSHHIFVVVSEPKFICLRMKSHANGVSNTVGNYFFVGTIRVDPGNNPIIRFVTNIAGRTDRNIEFAIRSKSNIAPAVMTICGIGFVDNTRLRGIQSILYICKFMNTVNFSDVEITILECNTVGHIKT